MFIQVLSDLILLFGLGLAGWFLLARAQIPTSELIGPVAIIGTLRALQMDLPTSPDFLFPVAQIIIGIFIGSMLNRDTIRELKSMAVSAVIIVAWALSVAFVIGFFLARYSVMDLYTAILSASMGGLPEITVIAMASGAGVAVIIVMQMIRMLGTVLLFPVLLKYIEGRKTKSANRQDVKLEKGIETTSEAAENCEQVSSQIRKYSYSDRIKTHINRETVRRMGRAFRESWFRILVTMIIATAGGLLLEILGVPAGLLVGSTIFVATASAAGIPVSSLSPRLLDLLLVAIGIAIADNISLDTFDTMLNPEFVIPILIATAIMFATSFGVAWIIYRLTGWDFPTSFLAAAPGGFTVMTALAIKHGLDPLKVSMLHLCRLLSINIAIPFVFLFLMN